MAVERLTDYTRRIWTGLATDAPDPDMQAGDVIYYMDTSTCSIITGIPAPGSIDTADLPDIGGGGGGYTVDEIASRSEPSGVIRITAEKVAGTAFRTNDKITRVEIPGTCNIGEAAFEYCAFTSIFAPNSTLTGNNTLSNNSKVTAMVLGSANNKQYWARYCAKLAAIDLSRVGSLSTQCLMGNPVLTALILRPSSVVSLVTTNVFQSTPFTSSGSGGALYVPQDMIAAYQNATNWATILSYPNNQILPIEGSIYETQYADGTPVV